MEPFLVNKEADSEVMIAAETVTQFADFDFLNLTAPTTTALSLLDPNITANSTALKGSAVDVMIHWPFLIAAIYYLVTLLVFILIVILYPENAIHPSRRLSLQQQDDPNAKKDPFKLNEPISNILRIFVIIVATISMHAYVGLEISFGSLLSPYAVKSNLRMTKSEG